MLVCVLELFDCVGMAVPVIVGQVVALSRKI